MSAKGKGKPQDKRLLLNIQVLFTLVTMAEIAATLMLSTVLARLSKILFERVMDVPDVVWLLIFSVVVGVSLSIVTNIILLRPIVKLSRGMKKVASGDFTIRMDEGSSIREVQECCASFNTMVQELGATETLQTDFVANVSHEFKTPINAIEGYATLLQGGTADETEQAYADRILMNTNRLSTLVGNILLLSKVSNHAIPIARSTYRLDEQIRQAILLLEPRWVEMDTEFDVEMEEISWTGPENLMHHVWNNLIGNAIKFGPRGGLVRLTLRQDGDQVRFTIEDEGEGIPEAEMQHVFNRFYQLDSSHKMEGNGLGLALVKQILDTTGGSIAVENLPERGCRFTVIL